MLVFSDELKHKPVSMLKFHDKKCLLESLQKGTLYMNTTGFFKKIEEEAKIKGIGDRNEATMVVTPIGNIKFYSNKTDKLLLESSVKKLDSHRKKTYKSIFFAPLF